MSLQRALILAIGLVWGAGLGSLGTLITIYVVGKRVSAKMQKAIEAEAAARVKAMKKVLAETPPRNATEEEKALWRAIWSEEPPDDDPERIH